jgi:regulator of protease activity HflC (stomatin/prohibitin superfamily)
MANMISMLRGAMAAAKAPPSGDAKADQARQAAEAEHSAAADHYRTIMRETGDTNQRAMAKKRLDDATEALGKF